MGIWTRVMGLEMSKKREEPVDARVNWEDPDRRDDTDKIAKRAAYSRPRLIVHGPVGALTRGTGGSFSDATGTMMHDPP